MKKNYKLKDQKTYVVENYFPEINKPGEMNLSEKVFLSPSRDIYIKNKVNLAKAFEKISRKYPEVLLDTETVSKDLLIEKIKRSYAVAVVSFSEVSPNLVTDALGYCLPVVMTSDTGLPEVLKELVIFVNPFSVGSIADGIEKLLDEETYRKLQQKISEYSYRHTWNEIAQEFLDIYKKIK